MTFMEFSRKVLEAAKEPLTPAEIWSKGKSSGLSQQVPTKGKTPWEYDKSATLH